MRLAAFGFALALLATGAVAQETAGAPQIHPEIGAHDPRLRVDPNSLPWRALGKLQAISGNLVFSCTGTLVGPATVLTAAHCVVDSQTKDYLPPSSLHFFIGFENGRYAGEAHGMRLVVGAGYTPDQPMESLGSDWALVTIDRRLGTPDRVLAIREHPPKIGTKTMFAGYSEDRLLVLAADPDCHIVGLAVDPAGLLLLRHNCTGIGGTSGAPLLVQDDGVWRIGGVQVGVGAGAANGFAVILDEARKKL